MFRKAFSLFLALMLLTACFVPTSTSAAEDPLVLHTEMHDSAATHYYLEDGTPARTELPGDGNYITYTYFGRVKMEEIHYENNIRTAYIGYDWYGTEVEYERYDETGEVIYYKKSEATYDEFGRLTGHHSQFPNSDTGTQISIRYEYPTDPTVFLGYYEQDGNLSNGPEPIEWLVVGAEEESLLLVSKYGLDSRPYHGTDSTIRWETSDIRAWLNGEFRRTAFQEAAVPFETYYESYFTLFGAPEKVRDRIFLLSLEEVQKYLPKAEDRLCTPTPYALQRNAYATSGTGTGWWLLRTPGKTGSQVVSINTDGSIDRDGGTVSSIRGLVRPAIWVNKTVFYGCENTPSRKHYNNTYVESTTGETKYVESFLYTYDDAGRMTCKQDYARGEMETWEYDDRGNLTRFTYQPGVGNDYAEGIYTNRYSDDGMLLEQSYQLYRAENGGNLKPVADTARLEVYTYDQAGRLKFTLTSRNGQNQTKHCTYDAQGHLLTVTIDGNLCEQYTYVPLSQAQAWEP